MMRYLAAPTLLAIALGMCSTSTHAQDRTPGWIGISLDVRIEGSRRRPETVVTITDVSRDSPADEAGIRVGDRLVAINDLDRASELRDIGERLRLRSGDRVRIVVEREGRRREMALRAARRPETVANAPSFGLSFEPDSMVEAIVRAMDSLRVRISSGQSSGIRRVSVETGTRGEAETFAPDNLPWVQAPFEFFVFSDEQHDSLAREMDQLNGVISDLRDLEETRVRQLARVRARSRGEGQEDLELRRVRATLQEVSRRSAEVRTAMATVARENAGPRYVMNPLAVDAPSPAIEGEPLPEFRPLTPYFLGRSRVAGAEVIDLRPELAEYFRVEGGVLVVDVPDGTPASIAGILPGDVVTRIDRVAVRSVDDLRFGVAQAGDTLPISLIRRGQSIQVLLRSR